MTRKEIRPKKVWLTQIEIILLIMVPYTTRAAVMPPPWANPKLNPCATQPRGWQLLYWPPDGRCYKIFQLGYPCPDGMELSPVPNKTGKQELAAECRCPPKTAQSATDGKCYELFSIGPCQKGYFFGPDTQYNKSNSSKREWGICKQMETCQNPSWIYWPKDGHCYEKLTRGPCSKGQLVTDNVSDNIPVCKCNKQKEFRNYRHENGQCYEHFTRGPCWEKGHLFLPDQTCGCYSFMPHFHLKTEQCFELGTIGPCETGEVFQLAVENGRGSCQCKSGYVRYQNTTSCYRPFTQGPCPIKHILINTTTCIEQPCERGHLYFLKENRCYRIGTRGPCTKGRVVTFDFKTRPSIDGISYNGMCMCERGGCQNEKVQVECDKSKGMARYRNKECYKLYAQGPCPRGAWLVPIRRGREELWTDSDKDRQGVCECLPEYTRTVRTFKGKNVIVCMSPTVILADYLNKNFTSFAQVANV